MSAIQYPRHMLAMILLFVLNITVQAESRYPLTVHDGLGSTLVFDKPPASVSSLTLFSDELLLELLDTSQIASLTRLSEDPEYSNVADRIMPQIPKLDFNVEALVGLYPDLVIAADWSEAPKVAQLRQAGIAVYLIKTPVSLHEIQQEIRQIAGFLNRTERAESLIQRMDDRLAARQQQVAKIRSKNWVSMDYSNWETSSGQGSTWNEVVKAAGLINGAESFEGGTVGMVPVSKEMIVDVNPDILFLPGFIYGDPEGAENFLQSVLQDPALVNVKAVQQQRVYMIPEPLKGSFSHYMVDAIEYVIDLVATE